MPEQPTRTDQQKQEAGRPDLTDMMKKHAGERLKPKPYVPTVDPALAPTRGKGG